MEEFAKLISEIRRFNKARSWSKFHDSKNLASAIAIEAAELNELFLWKTIAESESVGNERISEELADVLIFAFTLADKRGLDIQEIMLDKIRKNELKYPVEKAKGSSSKYNEL